MSKSSYVKYAALQTLSTWALNDSAVDYDTNAFDAVRRLYLDVSNVYGLQYALRVLSFAGPDDYGLGFG